LSYEAISSTLQGKDTQTLFNFQTFNVK